MTIATERRSVAWERVHTTWAGVREVTDAQLSHFCDVALRDLVALDPGVRPLAAAVRDLALRPGKRIRPLFVHYGWLLGGGGDLAAVAPCAAAMEMLHVMALLHDDVIDGSTERRGAPSAQVAFADRYRSRHRGPHRTASGAPPAGGAEAYGRAAAILAGDLALTWSDELFDTLTLTPEVSRRVRSIVHRLRAETIAGEYLDLATPASARAAEVHRGRALLKSGRYTVTRPLQLGVALGGQVADHEVLARFGDAVGLAFQVGDDLLDGDGLVDRAQLEALRLEAFDAAQVALGELGLPPPLRQELAELAHYAAYRAGPWHLQ